MDHLARSVPQARQVPLAALVRWDRLVDQELPARKDQTETTAQPDHQDQWVHQETLATKVKMETSVRQVRPAKLARKVAMETEVNLVQSVRQGRQAKTPNTAPVRHEPVAARRNIKIEIDFLQISNSFQNSLLFLIRLAT